MCLQLSPYLVLLLFSQTISLTDSAPNPEKRSANGQYKVVCYFANWAWYREGAGKYRVSNIDTDLCTHIVYAFAVLDRHTLTMKIRDTQTDIDEGFYEKVTALKRNGVKVVIALGGWLDSGKKYSDMTSDEHSRKKFVEEAIKFIKKYNFDGLELFWQYPTCNQMSCDYLHSTRHSPESFGFTSWAKELKEALKPQGLLLSAAVSPIYGVMRRAYQIKEISKYFDWITVLSFNYYGQWQTETGHIAPLRPVDVNRQTKGDDGSHNSDGHEHRRAATVRHLSVDSSIREWIDNGAPRDILVMGMPMYGTSYTLDNPNNNFLGAKASRGGDPGQFTRAEGFLAYFEICHNIRVSKWKVVRNPYDDMGPYAFGGRTWVGFDDVEIVMVKALNIMANRLAGAAIWSLDLDDFNNYCGCEKYPLLKAINRMLRNYPNPNKKCPL